MSTTTPSPLPTPTTMVPPECEPNYDLLITEDGKPVDGVFSEKQMRLLTSTLYFSWPGPGDGRPFLAHANLGLFFSTEQPPLVPDVLLSLDVRVGNPHIKKYRSYFCWVHGKTPDAVIEVVSNTEGEELGNKRRLYAKIGVPYYIVWDPEHHLGNKNLHCFELGPRQYRESDPWFSEIGLGVAEWHGVFEDWDNCWLRWCDKTGAVLPTAEEGAEKEKARANKLAAQLRALGFEPEQL